MRRVESDEQWTDDIRERTRIGRPSLRRRIVYLGCSRPVALYQRLHAFVRANDDYADAAARCRSDLPVEICARRGIDQPVVRKEVEAFEFKRGECGELVSVGDVLRSCLEDRIEAQRVGARFELRARKFGVSGEG